MKINLLADATALSDRELLARLAVLAVREREASAELVAHIAALEGRPGAYAAEGYGSLFAYCTLALRLSEDAACNRIEAARACRKFPVILDMIASGALSLTTVRVLSRHLTRHNHEAVLARAQGCSRREIDALVADLAPRPDVPPSVRKLPTTMVRHVPFEPLLSGPAQVSAPALEAAIAAAPSLVPPPPTARAIVQPTAPERYRIQFTVRRGESREAPAAPGAAPPGDSGRRSGCYLRPRVGPAPRAGREGEAGDCGEATFRPVNPSRDG